MSLDINGAKEVTRRLNATSKQVQRANRLVVNRVTRELEKDLGGSIPREHGTSVTGFRRVRAKKRLAKVRSKRISGVTWLGLNEIVATYAGRLKQGKKGAYAGRYFFEGAFVARMKSGHRGIFYRIKGSNKLEQATVPLPKAQAQITRAFNGMRPKIRSYIQEQLKKELSRKR